MTRHLRIYDHFTIPHLSNTATAWRMPPQHPPGSEGSRRDGCGTRGQNRCPGAAAGPGRASRSTTPSRRLACGDLAGGPPPTGTWTIGSAAVTREALHPLEGTAPVRGHCTQSGGLQCQPMGCTTPSATSANADWPHATTTWTPTCPARGPPVPHAGRLSRTWAGSPRLGTAGPRADEKAQAPHSGLARIAASLVLGCTPSFARGPPIPHAGRLFRTRAAYSARGPPVPYMGGVAQARNSRPTCG